MTTLRGIDGGRLHETRTDFAIEPVSQERIPPNDEGAERSILAAMLGDEAKLVTAIALVRPEHFFHRALRTVFEALSAMHAAGDPIDGVTLWTRLRETGRLAELGPSGLPGVFSVEHDLEVSAVGNVTSYCRAIRDAWRMRELLREAQRWTSEAYGVRATEGHVAGTPAQELLERVARTATDLAGDAATFTAQSGAEVAADAFAYISEQSRLVAEGRPAGVMTGLCALDQLTTGLHAPDLTFVAALPSVGKTALLSQVAVAAAQRGIGVCFFSLEMATRDIALRTACALAGVTFRQARSGVALPPEQASALVLALNAIANLPIVWDGLTLRNRTAALPSIFDLMVKAEREASAARARGSAPIGLVVVDYLQKIRAVPGRRHKNREEVVAEGAAGLKLLAVRLGVPVLCAAALNRNSAAERRKPEMRDLRESGAAEFDADAMWLLHRDDYKHERDGSKSVLNGECEIIVAKQRNGATGSAVVGFDRQHTRFYDLAEDDERLLP